MVAARSWPYIGCSGQMATPTLCVASLLTLFCIIAVQADPKVRNKEHEFNNNVFHYFTEEYLIKFIESVRFKLKHNYYFLY